MNKLCLEVGVRLYCPKLWVESTLGCSLRKMVNIKKNICFLVLAWPLIIYGPLGRLQGSLGLFLLICKMNIMIPVLPSSQCYLRTKWDNTCEGALYGIIIRARGSPLSWFRSQEKSKWTQGLEFCGALPLNQKILLELARNSNSVFPGTISVLAEVYQRLHCQYQQSTLHQEEILRARNRFIFIVKSSVCCETTN